MAAEEDSGGKDLYAVLELTRGASDEEIRLAFKNLAIINHPDKHLGDPKAALRFKRLNAAYQVLRDPAKREQYDQLTAPIEDFNPDALARPVPQPPLPPIVYEPEIRVRRRRVRRPVRAGWQMAIGALGIATFLFAGISIFLDRHSSEGAEPNRGGSSGGASSRSSALTPLTRAPVGERSASASGEHGAAGTANGEIVAPGTHPIVAAAGPDFVGRAVSGAGWELTVPEGWQDASPRDAKGTAWQAASDLAGLRPSVKVAVKTVTGDAPEYFKELDRKVPRGVIVDSEVWEYDSKPDGLRREGRVAIDGEPPSRFVEFVVVSHGKAYEVTCSGPDDQTSAQALCMPILGTLEIK